MIILPARGQPRGELLLPRSIPETAADRVLLPYSLGSKLEDRTWGIVSGDGLLSAPQPIHTPLRITRGKELLLGDATPLVPRGYECPAHMRHFKVVVKAREGGETLWVRPFATSAEAIEIYCRLIGLQLDVRHEGRIINLPGLFIDGDLVYQFATVDSFPATTTDSTKDWDSNGTKAPSGVSSVDYLVVAQGGGGGGTVGGGGGAGGLLTATGFAVTAGNSYTITVGASAGGGGNGSASGTSGSNSVFASITSTGGGGGGFNTNNGLSGGSGGGGANSNGGTAGLGGAGTAGQGNDGGAGDNGIFPNGGAGGGGGASAVGVAASGATGGDGGAGTASSISGSSVTYAGGGGGWGGTTAGSGGSGGGGAAASGSGAGNGTNGTTNRGGGGGGAAVTSPVGGNAGSGIVILSFTPAVITAPVFQPKTRIVGWTEYLQ